MARHNAYIRPRVKKAKEPFYITEEKRTLTVLSLIKARESISAFDIQKIMKFGPGVQERMIRLIKNNYHDVINWDKKTRLLKYIGETTRNKPTLEETPKEKPELSDNELNMMYTMKQEAEN